MFVVPEVCVEDLAEMAVPELATEFTITLCTFWRAERQRYTTEAIASEQLYMLLDSLTSVVLATDEDAA